jgi:hypothetical protein
MDFITITSTGISFRGEGRTQVLVSLRTTAVAGKQVGSSLSRRANGTSYSAAIIAAKGTAEMTRGVLGPIKVDNPYSKFSPEKILCGLNDLQLSAIYVAPEYEETPYTDIRRPIMGRFVSFLPGLGSCIYKVPTPRQAKSTFSTGITSHMKHNNKNIHLKTSQFHNSILYHFLHQEPSRKSHGFRQSFSPSLPGKSKQDPLPLRADLPILTILRLRIQNLVSKQKPLPKTHRPTHLPHLPKRPPNPPFHHP